MLAESSTGSTPYHYAGNNPVSYNDPNGALQGNIVQQGYNQPAPFLFWGLTHADEIRHGLNMSDVEDIKNGFTSAFFVNPYDGGGGGNSPMPPVYITFNDPGAPGSGGWVSGPSDGGGTGDGSGDESSSGGGSTGGSSGPRSWHWGGAAGRVWDDTSVPLTIEELTALNLI